MVTDTYERLRGVMLEQGVELPEDIRDKDSDFEDLDMDSLDKIEMIMAVEDEFEFEISDSEIEDLKTVRDLVNLIEART